MTVFETERLIVRWYERDEQENFFLVNGDEEVMRYIRAAKSRKECDRFLEETIFGYYQMPAFGRWAVAEKSSREFVGSFALLPIPAHEELIQLGYALLKKHWGKGFATELTNAGLAHGFSQLRLDEIYALTEKENVASQKVLLKAGFKARKEKVEDGKTVCWFLYKRKHWGRKK